MIRGQEPSTLLTDNSPDLTGLDDVQRMMALDMVTYLPDDILVKVDRAAMAASLETRVPFLDHRVVELAAGLNKKVLMPSMRTTKPILRELAKKYLPDPIINAPKRGFEMPIVKLMNNDLYDLSRAEKKFQ